MNKELFIKILQFIVKYIIPIIIGWLEGTYKFVESCI